MNYNMPHPFPYQGSKRGIAKHILPYFPSDIQCLVEPFCGAAAISIAAAAHGLTKHFALNDLNEPLMNLWVEILERPKELCDEYARQWHEQHSDKKAYFLKVRDQFNATHDPQQLLYLLARIVKGSVRYSSNGKFNQSADNRRSGMHPHTMRQNILGVSALLTGSTSTSSVDFRLIIDKAKEADLIYMDPPYQGTSFTRDHRYFNGLPYDDFVEALVLMNKKNISYIISYDGATGEKTHGKLLPKHLALQHIRIDAGRSSQATLLGDNRRTIESLYLSKPLIDRLQCKKPAEVYAAAKQQEIAFG
ncbi:MAG: Dam family site-specific DNA-(adenine-N6)-methyltransferase [Gammaproteobacteria bacterium]